MASEIKDILVSQKDIFELTQKAYFDALDGFYDGLAAALQKNPDLTAKFMLEEMIKPTIEQLKKHQPNRR